MTYKGYVKYKAIFEGPKEEIGTLLEDAGFMKTAECKVEDEEFVFYKLLENALVSVTLAYKGEDTEVSGLLNEEKYIEINSLKKIKQL